MAQYEINWSDLTEDAQERLSALYHDNVEMSPLAIIDIEEEEEEEEATQADTSEVTLFYRDGANYKYTEVFTIPNGVLELAKRDLGDSFYDQEEAQVQYDVNLGIREDDFHSTIGSAYNEDLDHNFVIIEMINGQPNTKPT